MKSVVETVTDELALQIASGAYAPGDRLPSVRRLAELYGLNPSTVQIVLGRLQSSGFVEPHQGIGFVVRDIQLYGGIETWRIIFQFAQRMPERASTILGDVLELRRALLGQTLRAIAAVRRAVDRLRSLIAAEPADLLEIARAELHAFRVLTTVNRHTVVTAVLNSIGEIYLSEPAVIAAMYVRPADHVRMWDPFLTRWEEGAITAGDVAIVIEQLTAFDAGVVARFTELLAGAPAAPKPPRRR